MNPLLSLSLLHLVPLHERLDAMTICYWETSRVQLCCEKGADIRTAGKRGLKYWVPLLQSKGWDKTQYITVWLDGELPPQLSYRRPSALPVEDKDVLTPDQIKTFDANRDNKEFDLTTLLKFKVFVVDGMNRCMALQQLCRESNSSWKSKSFKLRVLDPTALLGHKTAIAMAMNEKSRV
jgi:hypothetical protein